MKAEQVALILHFLLPKSLPLKTTCFLHEKIIGYTSPASFFSRKEHNTSSPCPPHRLEYKRAKKKHLQSLRQT